MKKFFYVSNRIGEIVLLYQSIKYGVLDDDYISSVACLAMSGVFGLTADKADRP